MSRMMSKSRYIALSSLFAALTAAGAWISIPFFPVPLTLQTFFVYLVVLILGRRAFVSQAIYIGMGLIGLPVFARGMSGYGALLGPTGGFIFGFLVGSFVGGMVFERFKRSRIAGVMAVAVCTGFVFGIGWVWLAYWMGWNFSSALLLGVLPFLPGDALKGALALIIKMRISSSVQI